MKHILALITALVPAFAAEPGALMPLVADSTQMWWAEGFPSRTPTAPWLRVIQTGRFALALNTDSLRVEHFGAVASLDDDFYELPAAELALSMSVDGKAYRCTSGGKWSRFTGPRLVESGRFFQRGDVTDLEFTADDGSRLNVDARFETAAWAERLTFIFAARPKPGEAWKSASLELKFTTAKGALQQRWELPNGQAWEAGDWREVALALDPVEFKPADAASAVSVAATELATSKDRPVSYDAALGWHRINLDGITPIPPPGGANPSNDAVERVKLRLSNPSDREQTARLMFEKTARGIRQGMGSSITGMSAILRDSEGRPTGIPVQLSKNWHNEPEGGVYAGQWFHGISQVRLPAGANIELELTLAYGHWGGVPAASHAQLSLIGWGSNQLWDQSALGAWGESICYEPDQAQANCTITDVRPSMVRSTGKEERWGWTSNVGGGDFFRWFDPAGTRVAHTAMRTTYHRQGPCLTEVTYAGRIGKSATHSTTVSLARTDDLVRGVYQLRLDVKTPADFSRFVIFQIGADTYSDTAERKLALGNESGLLKEWDTQWGGNLYRTAPLECAGRIPWISLHEAVPRPGQKPGAWANRGIIIRSWKARLGGKDAAPFIAERGLTRHKYETSTLDLVPPPGVTRFEPGDFIEATIEHIVMPQFAKDYYGPSEPLRTALTKDENTWRMIHREAVGRDFQIELKTGKLTRTHPAITIATADDLAEFTVTGGIGYAPVTFTGLRSPNGHALRVDDQLVSQAIHGNDFWQTDYDAATKQWSQTYNVPFKEGAPHRLRFSAQAASTPEAK